MLSLVGVREGNMVDGTASIQQVVPKQFDSRFEHFDVISGDAKSRLVGTSAF